MSTSLFTKKQIDLLSKEYLSNNIESALVELFLEHNKIKSVKNSLIKDCIKNSSRTRKIKSYFKERNFIPNLCNIVRIFELLIPKSDRELNGAVYTPESIVNYIINNTIYGDNKVCDPSCGSGAFLVSAARKISSLTRKKIIDVLENNIFGNDILDYSVERTKIILSLLALENGEDKQQIKFNIHNSNTLSTNWQKSFSSSLGTTNFDVVVGNPPYVKYQDLPVKIRKSLGKNWDTVSKHNFNLYFPFFEIGMRILQKNGKLGYIVPNNFFTSFAAEALRMWLQKNRYVERVIDFKGSLVFRDATTYTCITILTKNPKEHFEYSDFDYTEQNNELKNIKFDKVYYNNLNSKKWRLMKETDFENIKKIENMNTTLGKMTRIASGIATLKDKLYFIDSSKSQNDYFLKECNGKNFLIEKAITKKLIKISLVNNDSEIRDNTLRIIFPYERKSSKLSVIPEKELRKKYPKCYEYFKVIKGELAKRDKGKPDVTEWYEWGRDQALELTGRKLLIRTFSKEPNFMLDDEGKSLFCNGYAIFQPDNFDMETLRKILNSKIMDYYVNKTSYIIHGGYPCYQKNYIEKFGIPDFSDNDLEFLEKTEDQKEIDKFLIKKYNITI